MHLSLYYHYLSRKSRFTLSFFFLKVVQLWFLDVAPLLPVLRQDSMQCVHTTNGHKCSQRNQQKKKPLRITRVIKKVGNRKRKSHKIEVMSRKGRKKIRRKTENGRIFSINGSTWGLDLVSTNM